MVDDNELQHLRRCLQLAAEAGEAGDQPYASVLVGGDGTVHAEERNRETSDGDQTSHPEFALARWAARNLSAEQRAAATVFTSGEHCAMCSAAHGWVGLGRIVYAMSSEQAAGWMAELGAAAAPIRTIPIQDIAPLVRVEGPVPGFDEEVHELLRRFHRA